MAKEKNVNLEIKVHQAHIYIEGSGDLILNKMNARNTRDLVSERSARKGVKEQPNMWEDVITAIHWRDPINIADTYTECNEGLMKKLLTENAPCIHAYGMKKAFNQAVVRNEIDTYSTKFENAVNIVAKGNLVPIKFAEHNIDEMLMSPKRGSPILVHLNRFSGWSADFMIEYTNHVYSLEEIINIINLAGFGVGVGSGKTSGYGRFCVKNVEA